MAPARMVTFMEQHISQCEECLADPDVKQEADKIREIVLPPSKVPKSKVVRVPKEESNDSQEIEEDEDVETDEDQVEDGDDEDKVDDEEDDNGFNPDLLDEDDEI